MLCLKQLTFQTTLTAIADYRRCQDMMSLKLSFVTYHRDLSTLINGKYLEQDGLHLYSHKSVIADKMKWHIGSMSSVKCNTFTTATSLVRCTREHTAESYERLLTMEEIRILYCEDLWVKCPK